MTITATPSEVSYAGNGVTVAFAIPFVFDTSADIRVFVTDDGEEPEELSTGFAVTGGGGSTGTCTFDTAPVVGTVITILDDPELTQTADYEANDSFPEESHEAALDRAVRMIKRLHQRVGRSMRVADGDPLEGDDLLLPITASRAGLYLAFDSEGKPLASAGTGGGDSALRTDLAATTVSSDGSRLVGVRRIETGSIARSVFAKLGEQVSLADFTSQTGDGITSVRTAMQSAIDLCRVSGADLLIPPPSGAGWLIDGELDCTFSTADAQRGFAIRGLGTPCVDKPTFLFKHAGEHCFDLSASRTVRLENFTVHTDDAIYPEDCFFLARNAGGDSLLPKIYDVNVVGKFKDAILYNYGAEQGIYRENYWINRATDANAKTIILTANNIRTKSSNFVTIFSGNVSCIDHRFEGGTLSFEGGIATGDVFELDEAHNGKISKTFMHAFNAGASSRALFYVNMVNQPSNEWDLLSVQAEKSAGFIQQYGVLFSNHVKTPTAWSFNAPQLACGVAAIGCLGTNPILDQFDMRRIKEPNNRGLVHPGGVVQNSTWDNQALSFQVGTTRRNNLGGDFSAITWTTNENSSFDDRSVDRTFVPTTTALAVVGALTKSGMVTYRGAHAIVQISMSAATSITASAGNVIPVPKTPGFTSASVKFINTSTGTQVSGGYISGAGIVCPAFATGAGETMLIHAEYIPA